MRIVSPVPDPMDPISRIAWLDARIGIPTASRFDHIIQPKKLDYSGKSTKLVARLVAERLLGRSLDDDIGSTWSHRGTNMEAEALRWYAFQTDQEPERVGFCVTDDGRCGASPDALVGTNGGLEIKCFGAEHHVRCLLGEDPATVTQVQGGMWVCEREWWDQLGYLPGMGKVLIRTERDDKFIAALTKQMQRFLSEYDEAMDKIARMGPQGRVELRKAS